MSVLRVAVYSKNFINCGRDVWCRNVLNIKRNVIGTIRKEFHSYSTKCSKGHQVDSACTLRKYGIAGLGIVITSVVKHRNSYVFCKGEEKLLDEVNKKKEPAFNWRLLLKYLYPHIWHLLLAVTSALIVAVLNIWTPQCIGEIVNVLSKFPQLGKGDSANSIFSQLKGPGLTLARMYIAQAFFTFLYIFTLSKVGERVAMKLRQDLFKAVIMQDIEFFDKNRTGVIVSRLTSDIQDFKSTFKICISQGLRSFTQIVGCVVSVVMISPQLTAVMAVCVPTVIVIGTLLGSSLRKLSMKAQEQGAKATSVCEEAIQNIRTVRAFAAEHKESEVFGKEVEVASRLYENLGLGIGLFQAGTNLFLNGILVSTLYLGGHLMSTGQLSPGDVMAFLMATQTIQRSLTQLSLLFGSYIRGVSAGARVFEYLEMPPSPMMVTGDVLSDISMRGNIVFRDVTFSYPTRPDRKVLDKFNLNIPHGKTVAIVGSSGNGKTTVAALLERFYDVDMGSIEIDDRDIRSLNACYLRGNVLGYIDQEPILFATSILENIRYGKEDASDDEVIEAAKEANAHEFISQFPEGYETTVGERGTQLSGGQKQRIAIARALLKRPSIFILDEATSALDYESERVVQKALENVTKGRTVLIIAHRLSTVKGADIIVVLQKGKIVEMGTHTELLRQKGSYYTLVNEQEKLDENSDFLKVNSINSYSDILGEIKKKIFLS